MTGWATREMSSATSIASFRATPARPVLERNRYELDRHRGTVCPKRYGAKLDCHKLTLGLASLIGCCHDWEHEALSQPLRALFPPRVSARGLDFGSPLEAAS